MTTSLPIHAVCSALRRVPTQVPQPVCFDPATGPERGDAVVARVVEVGHHGRLEIAGGREVLLRPGMTCVLALGRRYSTLEFHGDLPEGLFPGADFHLLNTGGVAGRVVARNSLAGGPTRLEFLGYAATCDGARLRMSDFTIDTGPEAAPPAVILVVGSDMDVGKTAAAAEAIRALTRSGCRTAGVKLTGTSRMRDLFAMRDAGGGPVLDFADCGLPSTYGVSEECLAGMFQRMLAACAREGCRHVVVEVADGLFQPETHRVLSCAAIMERVSAVVLAAADSVGAYGGCSVLRSLGRAPDFLSGLFTASSLKIEEVRSRCRIPVLIVGSGHRSPFVEFVRNGAGRA